MLLVLFLARFLVLILGPAGAGVSVLELGRAVGSLFTDQLFCQLSAYTAATKRALLRGIKVRLEHSWSRDLGTHT